MDPQDDKDRHHLHWHELKSALKYANITHSLLSTAYNHDSEGLKEEEDPRQGNKALLDNELRKRISDDPLGGTSKSVNHQDNMASLPAKSAFKGRRHQFESKTSHSQIQDRRLRRVNQASLSYSTCFRLLLLTTVVLSQLMVVSIQAATGTSAASTSSKRTGKLN